MDYLCYLGLGILPSRKTLLGCICIWWHEIDPFTEKLLKESPSALNHLLNEPLSVDQRGSGDYLFNMSSYQLILTGCGVNTHTTSASSALFLTTPNRALLFPGHLKISNENRWKFWEPVEFFKSSVMNIDFKKSSFYNLLVFLLVYWLKKLFLLKWTIFLPSSPSLARSSTLNYFHTTFIAITPVCHSRWKIISSWEYYQLNAPSHNCRWYYLWKPHKASWSGFH